jgi:hypothetical protein
MPAAFYWFDRHVHGRPEQTDPWLSGFRELVQLIGANNLSYLGNATVPANSLVFVHPGESEDIRIADWIGALNNSQGSYIIFVSSYPGGLPRDLSGNAHCLEKSVTDFVASGDALTFKESYLEGNPNWQLLKSAPYPENLVAAYLLLVAKSKNIPVALDSDAGMWAEAGKEYRANGDAADISWGNYASWSPDEQKNIKAKLEKHFSDIAARD